MTSVTRPCFTTQHHSCKTKTKAKTVRFFWSETGLVLRPTVSDHITEWYTANIKTFINYKFETHVFHYYAASHTRTVVRECCKGDDASQWGNGKFNPLPRSNPLTDPHQKLHRLRHYVHMQNLVMSLTGFLFPVQWRRNRGFRRFNEPGPPSSWGPRVVRLQKNFRQDS